MLHPFQACAWETLNFSCLQLPNSLSFLTYHVGCGARGYRAKEEGTRSTQSILVTTFRFVEYSSLLIPMCYLNICSLRVVEGVIDDETFYRSKQIFMAV